MSETRVVKVGDGEELVFEGVTQRRPVEDARARTIEARRLAVPQRNSDEDPPAEGERVMKPVRLVARNAPPPANPPRTEGLTPLDRDRASSIADEGGASAAEVEKQRPPRPTVAPVPGEDAIDPDETPTQPWAPVPRK